MLPVFALAIVFFTTWVEAVVDEGAVPFLDVCLRGTKAPSFGTSLGSSKQMGVDCFGFGGKEEMW